jgi:dihydropteroate synthase
MATVDARSAPPVILRAGDRELRFTPTSRPLIMGVLNATPDSFSDRRDARTLDDRVRLAEQLLEAGADLIDIGGESNVTDRPAVGVQEELDRVVGLIERVSTRLGALVSVDTYKAPVAEAAIAAGARIVNDISGLGDPALVDVCARTGAGLVLMHTAVAPKTQELREDRFADPGTEVRDWLADRLQLARGRGVHEEQVMLDPGPDFGKTPAQTIATLRGLPVLAALGRPLLLAVSRKDFLGAIVERRPRERLASTLAAVGYGADHGGNVFRVHDVREVADFLAVRAVLRGDRELDPGARVPEHLRREAPAA